MDRATICATVTTEALKQEAAGGTGIICSHLVDVRLVTTEMRRTVVVEPERRGMKEER